MKVTKVCCQGCGADLQVDESVRYVTCNFCNSRLEIVHDPTVTHSRLLEKIERTTDQMIGNLKVIKLQNDLERLDREWEQQRENLLIRDKNGSLLEPSEIGTFITSLVFVLMGCVMFIFLRGISPQFTFLGLLPILLGSLSFIFGMAKAKRFNRLKQHYRSQRHRLTSMIDREREL